MINKIALLLALAFISTTNAQSIDIDHPKLFFSVGYPFISVQSNEPKSGRDFLSLSIGATMEYQVAKKSSVGFVLDASYTPDRKNILIDPNGRKLSGSSSLLSSYYSLVYSHDVGKDKENNFILSFGPTIGLHTLDFDEFEENNTRVNTKNRVRLRNYGARFSIKSKDKDTNNYWEVAYYYLRNNHYTIIDDASNDAGAVYEDSSVANDVSWSILINYGMRIF